MTPHPVERDERTVAVENAGYRWSYLVLSFGLLAITVYRSLMRGEATWDLLALVMIGGVVNAVYQVSHRTLYPRWMLTLALTVVLAALIALGVVFFRGAR